jgi:hypothetical protein
MRARLLLWAILPVIAGCLLLGDGGGGGGTEELTVNTAELSGEVPTTWSGTPTVAVDGHPAVIANGMWTRTVTLPASQTQVEVVFALDGVEVARRHITIVQTVP